MTLLWAFPVVVLLVGAVVVAALVRMTTESARELAAEVVRFGEVHVRLAQLRSEAGRGCAVWNDLRHR